MSVTVRCCKCGASITRCASKIRPDFNYCSKVCSNEHRASRDRPEMRFEGDVALIPLNDGHWAKVDRADYESIPMLSENWTAIWYEECNTYYAVRRINQVGYFMHRVVTGAPDDCVVNHRSHDGLDNREENLDVCTNQQNLQYGRKRRQMNGRPTTSRYKGVSWNRRQCKWVVFIADRYVGSFESEGDAAEAYNEAATAAFGHFAQLNEIE